MCQSYRRVCGIDALTAVSGGTEHVEFTVVEVQMKIDLLRLRHDRHRTGGGMDTSSRLCFGHTLHTVYAALILQSGVSACSVDHESHFLESADPVIIQTVHLGLPATPLRILHIHT